MSYGNCLLFLVSTHSAHFEPIFPVSVVQRELGGMRELYGSSTLGASVRLEGVAITFLAMPQKPNHCESP